MSTHAERSASARKAARTRKRNAAKRLPNPRGVPKDADSLWRIRREVLDSGGYTKGKYPQYFGRGEPLFAVESPEGNVTHIRAYDKEEAIERIKRRDPGAKFLGDRARAKKRVSMATTATRPWRITLEYSGNNYGPAKQVHEFVDAATSDVAIRTARRRHDGARVVTIRPLDIYPIENPPKRKRPAAKRRR
jgi:hypothetical protein